MGCGSLPDAVHHRVVDADSKPTVQSAKATRDVQVAARGQEKLTTARVGWGRLRR